MVAYQILISETLQGKQSKANVEEYSENTQDHRKKEKERKEKGNEWRERGKRGKRLNIPNLYIKGRAPYFLQNLKKKSTANINGSYYSEIRSHPGDLRASCNILYSSVLCKSIPHIYKQGKDNHHT